MKKVLLLLAAGVSTLAVAQTTESKFMDAVALLGEGADKKAVNVSQNTVLASSDNVSMSAAWDDTYKIVALAGEDDAVNQVTIDGVNYACPKGIQGQTNPTNNRLASASGAGAVFRFDVKESGWLYVISKVSKTKNYFVWEGAVENISDLGSFVVKAYTLKAFSKTDGKESTYTLPGDADGIFSQDGGKTLATGGDKYLEISWERTYVKFENIDESLWLEGKKKSDKITWTIYNDAANVAIKNAVDTYVVSKGYSAIPEQVNELKDGDNIVLAAKNMGMTIASASACSETAGSNAFGSSDELGVIAFPVIASGVYFVNATGSKITCDGYVFIPGATSIATISAGKSDAIKNITIDDLDENAPIYNVLGQKVQKGYKGICIQNGKKFIVK